MLKFDLGFNPNQYGGGAAPLGLGLPSLGGGSGGNSSSGIGATIGSVGGSFIPIVGDLIGGLVGGIVDDLASSFAEDWASVEARFKGFGETIGRYMDNKLTQATTSEHLNDIDRHLQAHIDEYKHNITSGYFKSYNSIEGHRVTYKYLEAFQSEFRRKISKVAKGKLRAGVNLSTYRYMDVTQNYQLTHAKNSTVIVYASILQNPSSVKPTANGVPPNPNGDNSNPNPPKNDDEKINWLWALLVLPALGFVWLVSKLFTKRN